MITQVSPTLYRGPRPDDMTALLTLKVKNIINLEVGWFEWFHGDAGHETTIAVAADINIVHIPFDDLIPPNKAKISHALNCIYFAEKIGPVYLHCLHGEDRTGIVSAAYRVNVQGWKLEDAIAEMYVMGFHKVPYLYLGWVNALREFCG